MSPKLLVPFCALIIGGCASQPSSSSSPTSGLKAPSVSDISVPAGRSFETAVVIQAADESAGVKAEYAWIHEHIPGSKPAGQSLQSHGTRMYDLIHVTLANGSMRDVYFDITGFFGKL